MLWKKSSLRSSKSRGANGHSPNFPGKWGFRPQRFSGWNNVSKASHCGVFNWSCNGLAARSLIFFQVGASVDLGDPIVLFWIVYSPVKPMV
jgi:hypothetical protein